MAYTLNIDTWDWINPETQKVLRLRKGDDIPEEVLAQEGIDIEEMTKGRNPQLVAKHSDEGEAVRSEPRSEAATASAQGSASSPKRAESK